MKPQVSDLSITLGEYGHHIIQHDFQKFVDHEGDVFKDKDPEPLHQMRVGMRRLRTAIQVFGPAIALPKPFSHTAIGKIAKRLGATRDLDVLQQALITRYQPLLPKAEQAKFRAVLKHVHQQRAHSFLDLQKTLQGDRYHRLKHTIQTWVDQPVYTRMADLPIQQVLPDLLLPLLCHVFLHPGWLVGTTLQAGDVTLMPIENGEELHQQGVQCGEVLHDLRKQMKGVRYQAEFFAEFYAAAYRQRIEEFKAIQDILGQFQDQIVLQQFLELTLHAELAKVLPTVNQVMQQDQADFWRNWQPLQQRYLAADFRQSVRSLLATPLALTPSRDGEPSIRDSA
jgi:CHAD domain-containing protein